MTRALRRLAIVVLAVAALIAISLVVLRQSLLRGPLREAAEARLSAALGQPVVIGALGVSLVPPIAVTGTNIRVGSRTQTAPGIALDTVRIVPRLRSLFSGTIDITEVRLDGFVVSVLRARDGSWHVPPVGPAPTAGSGSPVSIARVRIQNGRIDVFDELPDGTVRSTARIDAVESEVSVDGQGLHFSPLRGRIGDAAIEGEARAKGGAARLAFSAAEIRDRDLDAALALLGSTRPEFLRLDRPASLTATIHVEGTASRLTGQGRIMAPAVTVDPLRLAGLEAPFTIEGPRLTFEPTTFALYGGAHRGTISVRLDGEPARWSTTSRVERMDLGPFLDALAGEDARLDGTAQMDAAVGGPVGAPLAPTLQGRARVVITDGVVHGFPLLAAINRVLRVAEGDTRDTRFERLSATLAIGNGRATTDDLVLDARDVRVVAAGTIGFDRSLDLRGRATLSAERTAAVVSSVRELARLRRNGVIELPLTIGGTLDDPAFNVDVTGAIEKGITDELLRRLGRIIRR